MLRILPHSLLLLLLMALLAPACAPPSADDDDTSDDDDASDDDDDDDDDDDVDECLSPNDVSDNIGGEPVVGSTIGSEDGFFGTCSEGAIADDLLVFTAPVTGAYAVSTDNENTSFDTLIYAFTDCYDAAGSELACNDDVEEENTNSLISFEAEAGQDVYIAVEGYDDTGVYELTLYAAVCGDGQVVSGEACDDGNQDDGDGCDSECNWECPGEDEQEDDDTLDTATLLTGSSTFADLYLCSSDWSTQEGAENLYVDFFQIEVAEGEYLAAELLPPGAETDCSGMNAAVTIFDGELNEIAGPRRPNDGRCPRLANEPTAGTYYVAVHGDDPQAAPESYGIDISVGVSVCGDGLAEGTEQCDDGNLIDGDGCAASCTVEDDSCTETGDLTDLLDSGTATSDDTTGAPDEHRPTCTRPGSPDHTYFFTASETGPILVSTDYPGTDYDSALHVRTICLDPSSQIACNDDKNYDAGNYNAELTFDAVAGETYAIIVDGYRGAEGNYELVISSGGN